MPTRKKAVEGEADKPKAPARKKPATKKPAAPKAEGAVTKTPTRRRSAGDATGPDLVIVESPAKANTINKYLGSNFKVMASYGHVRDLPKGRKREGEEVAGVNIAKGWVPRYEVPKPDKGFGRRKTPQQIIAELKKEAGKANLVYLATDPDREGEAIAWHIFDELKLTDERTFRVTFNEITKTAVTHAIANPEKIDMDRVRAQEARRILDRVVGYPLSSLLGDKITKGLSAGRVQSVALRLVVDREREIEAFKTDEYWKIIAELAPTGSVPFSAAPFRVVMAKKKATEGEPVDPETPAEAIEKVEARAGAFRAELAEWAGTKFAVANEEDARRVAELLDRAAFAVTKLEQKDRAEKAPPPFTTSTIQQQANLRLRFSAKRTMDVAQKLYEGVPLGSEGQVALITYMRTDSTRVSNDALTAVRSHIGSAYGDRYLPAKPNMFASGKSAQEAHEAIRPTDVEMTPQRAASLGLAGDQLKLYGLVYNRFLASQMNPAIFAVTNVEASATVDGQTGLFKAQGKILKFDGFRRVYSPGGKQEDATLPNVSEGQTLDRLDLAASQHFTQPPPRYNEASLVKALEKEGIGRPSTYAAIIGKITSEKRGYIEVKERRFYATEVGKAATDLLVQNFPQVMDLKFTAHMEEDLDLIATKQMGYEAVLNEFWDPFSKALNEAKEKLGAMRGQETGEACPTCGKPLVVKFSKKTGNKFVGCSGYLEGCKYIKPREGEEARPAAEMTDTPCPTCGKMMLKRMSKRGPFLGCEGYPECKTTMNLAADGTAVLASKATDHKCDKCGAPMVLREGKRGPFLGCSAYPKCRSIVDVDADGNPVRPKDTGIKCEKCGAAMIIKRGPRGPFLACSAYPKCKSYKSITADLREQLKDLIPPAPVKKDAPAVEIRDVCPECGGLMKLRQGRGGYFLGCAKYPKCRGTMPASPELLEQITALATQA